MKREREREKRLKSAVFMNGKGMFIFRPHHVDGKGFTGYAGCGMEF